MIAQKILQGCEQMGIPLTQEAAQRMDAYWQKVLVRNETMNLTRVTEEQAAVNLHFLDSLAPLMYGDKMLPHGASVCDLGTGAGFPGMPLLIARPDLRMTLMDARRKRLDFIREAADVPVRLVHARAEDVRERFDVICARAVTNTPDLCKLVIPLLRPGGWAIFWKGPAVLGEMEEASKVISRLGGCLIEPVFYELPQTETRHCLILAERNS